MGDILEGFFSTAGANSNYRKKIASSEIEKIIHDGEKRYGKYGIEGEIIIWDKADGKESRRKERNQARLGNFN